MTIQFKPFVDQRSCRFEMMYRRPLLVANALARLSMSCFVPKIKAVKIAVNL